MRQREDENYIYRANCDRRRTARIYIYIADLIENDLKPLLRHAIECDQGLVIVELIGRKNRVRGMERDYSLDYFMPKFTQPIDQIRSPIASQMPQMTL